MAFCGTSPGMCGKKADCADHHCPGRLCAIFEERQGGALIEDGYLLEDAHEFAPSPAPIAPLIGIAFGLTALAYIVGCACGWF